MRKVSFFLCQENTSADFKVIWWLPLTEKMEVGQKKRKKKENENEKAEKLHHKIMHHSGCEMKQTSFSNIIYFS